MIDVRHFIANVHLLIVNVPLLSFNVHHHLHDVPCHFVSARSSFYVVANFFNVHFHVRKSLLKDIST